MDTKNNTRRAVPVTTAALAASFILGAGATHTLPSLGAILSASAGAPQVPATHAAAGSASGLPPSTNGPGASLAVPTAPPTPASPVDTNIFVNLVRQTVPAVVNISTLKRV